MNFLSATILVQRHGPDIVYIQTDLPEAIFPFEGILSLEFRATRKTGYEYVRTHFPLISDISVTCVEPSDCSGT